jgi:hypothetical protein
MATKLKPWNIDTTRGFTFDSITSNTVSTSTVVVGNVAISDSGNGNIQIASVAANGQIGTPAPVTGGGVGVTVYDTVAELPESGTIGSQAFVTGNNKLYVWNGISWVDISANVRNYFYIVQTDQFTGPITGDQGYTPTRTIQLQSIEAVVSSKTSINIIIRVRKNNTTLQEFTITGDNLSVEADFSNNTFTTSDDVFLDIVEGSGTDLVVKFNYS